MPFGSKPFLRAATAGAFASIALTIPQGILAQAPEHLVNPTEMQKAVADASQTRQANVDTLDKFFSSDEARKALQSSQMDPQQVKSAVANLSDEELAQLAARANKAQMDFAAGNMNDHDLLLILIVIAALILIIVAVH